MRQAFLDTRTLDDADRLTDARTSCPAEHYNRTMTRALGSPYRACYLMAICIFGFGILRDGLCELLSSSWPRVLILSN